MTFTIEQLTELLRSKLAAANAGSSRVDIFVGEATPTLDSDKLAHPYIVLYPSPGLERRTEEDLQASPGVLDWQCQATCAGGDYQRALRALDRLQSVVLGQSLAPETGFIRKEGNLGPIRKDLSVTPNRWYVPVDLVMEA